MLRRPPLFTRTYTPLPSTTLFRSGYSLATGGILCVTRAQRDPRGDMWVDLFASDDGGKTWDFLSRVNDFGAPGSLVVKKDGRFVMVYGYRLMPSGMRCRVSEDEGKTWGPELIKIGRASCRERVCQYV